jgi:hypothetical protein
MVAVAMVLALQILPPPLVLVVRGRIHSRTHKSRSCLWSVSTQHYLEAEDYNQSMIKYKDTQGHNNQAQACKPQTNSKKNRPRPSQKTSSKQHSILEEVNI